MLMQRDYKLEVAHEFLFSNVTKLWKQFFSPIISICIA